MKILDRYIGSVVGRSSIITLIILLTLFSFFKFIDELENIGKGSYTAFHATEFVLMTMPSMVYQLFPIAVLLGSMIGLGALASNGELTVIRVSGVSLARIIWSVMKVGIVLVLIAFVIGEWIAPLSENYARIERAKVLSKNIYFKGDSGLWARDGKNIINIRQVLPGNRLGEIYLFKFDKLQRLKVATQAKNAVFDEELNRWILYKVVRSHISTEKTTITREDRQLWRTSLTPNLLNVVVVKPDALSTLGLNKYINYLRENGLNSERYELAIWNKIASPFMTAVMVLLAIPFVLGPLRSVSIGKRIFVGVLMGISIHLFNQAFGYVSLVYHMNPIFSAFFPTGLFFVIAIVMLRKTL